MASSIPRPGHFPARGFLHALVNSLYNRAEAILPGNLRVKGDTVDINLPYVDFGCRISFFMAATRSRSIDTLELSSGKTDQFRRNAAIFPPEPLCSSQKDIIIQQVIHEIQDETAAQTTYSKLG